MDGKASEDETAPRQPGADGGQVDQTRSLDLVQEIQTKGSEEALNELVERYYDRVLRIVRARLGPHLRKHTQSLDIVQEALTTGAKNIETFEPRGPGSILGWLAKIVDHKISDLNDYVHAQKRDRRLEVPLEVPASGGGDGDELFERDLAADEPQPEDRAALMEFGDLIDEAMRELSDEHREVILLRDYFGGEWPFVAEQLGRGSDEKGVHATQELHRRAKEKLKEKLRPKLGPEVD